MHSRTDAHGRSIAVAAALAALIVGAGQNPATASAYVSATQGSADGYYLSVSLFGGPPNTRGPAPTVTLAADASNSPQTATASSGSAVVGPATFFTSGQLDVRTEGTLGPSGSVTSSTSIANLTGDEGEPSPPPT